MTIAFDPSTDFATVDGLAEVTLRARNGAETTIEKSLRRAVSHKEAKASDGKYTTDDVVFHFAASEVAARPTLGSQIIDDAGRWTILEVALQTLGSRFRCVCRDLAVAAGLDTLLTIQQATFAKGASGALEPTWADLYTNVRGKIIVDSADRAVDGASVHQPRTARIVLETQYLLDTAKHRVVDGDGALYKITGWESPDRIDELFTLKAEVTKWPLS